MLDAAVQVASQDTAAAVQVDMQARAVTAEIVVQMGQPAQAVAPAVAPALHMLVHTTG
jgi:hypothetical protein